MEPWGYSFASITAQPQPSSPILFCNTGPLRMQDDSIWIKDLGVEWFAKHSLLVELIQLLMFSKFPFIPDGWLL